MAFSGSASDLTEMTDNERIGKPEQNTVQLYADSEKAREVTVSTTAT